MDARTLKISCDIEAFILAGGASRRMGVPKQNLMLGGETILTHIVREVEIFAPNCTRLILHDREETFIDATITDASVARLPCVFDLQIERSSMSGIHAALTYAHSSWVAVVACDLPFVRGELFARLIEFCASDVDVIVPLDDEHQAQPLCALYRRETCLPRIVELLAADEKRVGALLENLAVRRVKFEKFADITDAERFFLNLNTPADYELAQRLFALDTG